VRVSTCAFLIIFAGRARRSFARGISAQASASPQSIRTPIRETDSRRRTARGSIHRNARAGASRKDGREDARKVRAATPNDDAQVNAEPAHVDRPPLFVDAPILALPRVPVGFHSTWIPGDQLRARCSRPRLLIRRRPGHLRVRSVHFDTMRSPFLVGDDRMYVAAD
jgi:hypothetical protein